jgi:Ca2+-binding EF-hand superfamily protein
MTSVLGCVGELTEDMITQACRTWGILLTDEDFSIMNSTYSHQESSAEIDRGINYAEFIAMLTRNTTYTEGSGEAKESTVGQSMKTKILDGVSTMKEAFKIFDRDSSGSVDRDEMRRVLSSYRIAYNERELDQLFAAFDRSGDGKFSYGEFVTLLQNISK